MDNWRDIVTSYPDSPEPKDYAKVIRAAEIILGEDLAPFETEWIAQTFLFKPIGLFETIATKRNSDDWLKTVSDSFKVLTKIVEKFWDVVENYYNEIVKLCMLPFDVQTRKEAILCLISVVKHPSVEISDEVVSRNVGALEDAKTCKAPLAQLVGTICRYHPERVQEHYSRIWRIYLNMLQPNNKTDNVVNSVLQGINGLFEYFGDDIEIIQLNSFYDMMSRECIKISKCLDVLLSILKHHARLFKERLANDKAIRLYMWQIETKLAMDAISNVYAVVFSEANNTEEIINTEILPHIDSSSILIKHTALRIIIQVGSKLATKIPSFCSGIDLEFQLRTKKLSYEEASTVSWCINSNVSNSETMLLTSIMYYDNLPSNRKRDIVVSGVLKASDDGRKAALILLLKLCLQDHLDKYIDIWRTLLDNTTNPELGKAVIIFEDILHHILEVLASFAEDSNKVYTEVRPILAVMAILLSLQMSEFHTHDWCISFRPSMVHLAKLYAVEPLKMLSEIPENEIIYVEKFQEDTVLSTLVSTLAGSEHISDKDTLSALQVIFSREGSDLKLLSQALSRLEVLMGIENNNLDKRQLSMIINKIIKLKKKHVMDNKDARIFQKDVMMFLGKYEKLCREESFSEDIHVLKFKNKVTLNIFNVFEGTTYKIDLQRIFQLCLLWGESEALYTLLVILAANLCNGPEPGIQEATIRVIYALFRSKIGSNVTDVNVYPALLMCNTTICVQEIMKSINEELCPEVRRKLSECLEVLLTHEPGSELTGQLLNIVAEQVLFMVSRDDPSTIVPVLDVTRSFLSALKDNNSLTVEHLPNILICVSNIIDEEASEIFQIASNIFTEKIDLFTEIQIKNIIIKMIENNAINVDNTEINLNTILSFTKRVVDVKKYEPKVIIDDVIHMCKDLTIVSPEFVNLVAILALSNNVFELNTDIRKKVVDFENGLILNELSEIQINNTDVFKVNAVLIFMKEYGVELMEMNCEKTIQCLGNIIENIPPTTVLQLKKHLYACISVYKSLNEMQKLVVYYEKWYKKLDLINITDYIEQKILFSEFSETFSDIIHALKIMSELLDIPTSEAKTWTSIIVRNMNSKNELKWGRIFLSDLLIISEKSLSVYEFEEILENNLEFVRNYVNVYFKRLIEKPFTLAGDKCCLIVEIVEYYAKTYKEEYFENVVELVDSLWSKFLEKTTFDEKQSVLLNLLRLPKRVSMECAPVKWAISLLNTEGTSLEDRIKLIATLPAGEEYSLYYRSFAYYLPVRLSEMKGEFIAPFRALLDTLATNGDMTLLDIVMTLAGGDDSKGWWDHAIDACMTALASKEDLSIFDKAYKKCKSVGTLGVCNRIFLPLLRHSSRKFCEKYISTVVVDLFSVLRVGFKEPTNSDMYRKRVVSYAIVFNILTVVFEKIPSESLECGVLNESAGSAKPWYFLEQTCKYCVTISANVKCPTDASDELKDTCLWLQCSSYNCLTTAICRRKPNKKLYERIFDVQAWNKIVDKDAVYPFYLTAHAKYRGSRPTKRSVDAMATSSSFTGTVRSRLFLTTLSENPLQFDMIPQEEGEEPEDDSPEYEDSVLNTHGCLTTMTSLFEHASMLEHSDWRAALVLALTSDTCHVNAKWLLAQAVCYAEQALQPHASALCAALLQLTSDTPAMHNGKLVLNNLHLDIVSTIIKWNIPELSHSAHLDTVIEYIIYTCIEFKHRASVHRRLLNILNSVLQLYGSIVRLKWEIFQDYCKDPPNYLNLFPIFDRLLKNKVSLPELLPTIFANPDTKQWTETTKLAEICGLALSMADSVTRDNFLAKFWHLLNTVRGGRVNSYVKILYYAQKHCDKCCDFQQFKIITDLTTKVEKSKCLSILSTYLQHSSAFDDYFIDMFEIISLYELLESDLRIEAMRLVQSSLRFMDNDMKNRMLEAVAVNCRNSSVGVRKEAFGVILRGFQDLAKPSDNHPSKRRAMDSSPILNTIDSPKAYDKLIMSNLFAGMFDSSDQVAKMVIDGVEECLSEDISIRFAELFYIIIYQSSVTTIECLELSKCGTKLLELLFSDLRNQEAFKAIRIRDEDLPQRVLKANDAITTVKTYAKTVQRSGVTFRQKVTKASERRHIDVRMPVTDILETFLQLAKVNSQVCQELNVQMMKCLQGTGRRFDLDSVISKQLYEIIKRPPNCLTPLVLDACRVFINGISSIPGFKLAVESLRHIVCNSEGYLYANILYEDLLLRNGDRNQFIFSMLKEDDDDSVMREQQFSLQELIKVFGSLSNWDDLRLQEKRQIEGSLPPLWTMESNFTESLRNYFEGENKKLDYSIWFNKMVASYYPEEVTQDRISWLKQIERWPRRDFVTSVIIEAIQWHQSESKIVGNISSSDCLAEWAARLMIRSAYMNQSTDSDTPKRTSSPKDELLWCKEANKRSLPNIVLQCIERNKESLLNDDILPWVQEKVMACRTIALRENNYSRLHRALEAAEKQAIKFRDDTTLETNISMQKLILQLHHDLRSLSITKLDDIMQDVSIHLMRKCGRSLSSNNVVIARSIYEIAMIFYDQFWIDNDEITQNDIISKMMEVIDKVLEHNLTQEYNLLFSIILNRLTYFETTISVDTARSLLDQICRVFPKLDFFSVDILKKVIAVLPSSVINKDIINKLQDVSLDECKEYFQLICDVNYLLLQYCDSLRRNVFDDTEWNKVFRTMKNTIFDVTCGGSDYQSLNTLKSRLYALEDLSSIDAKATELKHIIDELRNKSQRPTLRLSQLSPNLCSPSSLEVKRRELQRLLRLPPNVYVVKFEEQVSVFTDSIRRPCVIKALLSNGITRRYIIKTGEPMLNHAAVQRASAILGNMCREVKVRSYHVTPLSDDSAIIDYLEDHVRIRDLMEQKHDINNVPVMKAGNDKLILAPSLALEQYNALCDAVTPYILRTSIESNCSCVQEFISKKRTFEDTLASMSIISWLFGVGDRHLQNIMYSVRDGGVCGVDWASVFQYGVQELPPARLTANLLAVCDVKVLESRLQTMLEYLRNCRKLYAAFIRNSFYWLGPEFKELKHITHILEGNAVSYEITRSCIEESEKKYKVEYMRLLDQVFENFTAKGKYSIEEQVSCLLQHCTEPRILSVTPQGWEAWL